MIFLYVIAADEISLIPKFYWNRIRYDVFTWSILAVEYAQKSKILNTPYWDPSRGSTVDAPKSLFREIELFPVNLG